MPTLIIIGGFAGAGKTTIASRLAADFRYTLFSSDVINDALRGALNKSFKEVSPIAHKVMWHLVRNQLQLGVTTIVDTHMATASNWESLDELKTSMPDIAILPIILEATLETHRSRIEERGLTNKQHLNLGGEKLENVLFKYDFINKLQRSDLIKVDANGEANEVYLSIKIIVKKQLHSD